MHCLQFFITLSIFVYAPSNFFFGDCVSVQSIKSYRRIVSIVALKNPIVRSESSNFQIVSSLWSVGHAFPVLTFVSFRDVSLLLFSGIPLFFFWPSAFLTMIFRFFFLKNRWKKNSCERHGCRYGLLPFLVKVWKHLVSALEICQLQPCGGLLCEREPSQDFVTNSASGLEAGVLWPQHLHPPSLFPTQDLVTYSASWREAGMEGDG